MSAKRGRCLQATPNLATIEKVSDAGGHTTVLLIGEGSMLAQGHASLSATANQAIAAACAADRSLQKTGGTVVVQQDPLVLKCVLGPTGPLSRDIDDVRRYGEAAREASQRAVASGTVSCVLVVLPPAKPCDPARFLRYVEVATLAVLACNYSPLEFRERVSEQSFLQLVSVLTTEQYAFWDGFVQRVQAVEAARVLARDVCGCDPERMTPARVAEHLLQELQGKEVSVRVENNWEMLQREYPLLAAVARCSVQVPRHHPCVIHLEYTGSGPITDTLFFVGKGIVYDTGGADVKAGGHMAGMHRDKGGAAVVAGFFKALALLKPKGVRAVGKLAMVRNSIGADSYVADEIILSRAGVAVRVGNTDAEGRMVMSDLLCQAKEQALEAVNPSLFTIATLTGHAGRACGEAYSIVMDNGAAKLKQVHNKLCKAGDSWADPFEISTLRREDFEYNKPKYYTEDVVQCGNAPSSMTDRGHQVAPAFMTVASGLDKHDLDASVPLAYTHMDIAGSTRMHPTPVSAAPLPALIAAYCF
eukprot:m.26843 g.26843  ORF g.26843 m.26843 type:complete len:531 (-) comp11580_c0_seq3:137-1729(-)